jgi:hypothetical protein
MQKMVVVKGVFAGQERRGWFPALTGVYNKTGKSDQEASTVDDSTEEGNDKLGWMVEFSQSLLSSGEVRVVEVDSNYNPIRPLH